MALPVASIFCFRGHGLPLLTDSLVSFCKYPCDGTGPLGTIKDNQPLHLKYLNVFFLSLLGKIPSPHKLQILGSEDAGIFVECYSASQNSLLFQDDLISISHTAPLSQQSTKLRGRGRGSHIAPPFPSL